ncbi:unnamed protein product [Psylliodes chrysocephalus]|uniref:Uncharacterized protein n=1 Tax=Psylliodes chrysocephalus TaxID=3402493 RepID=A0A9P0CPB0_9CUCU|nr:unnamed protein product [Psylliodes chrysocephala]
MTSKIQIYNELSQPTLGIEQLKEFFDWMDMEWSELLRHAVNRRLSLLPAVDQLLRNFTAIKSYFLSKNHVALHLRMFFEDDLSEAYLGFIQNIFQVFQPALKKLQGDEPIILELYKIMNNIKISLTERRNEKFYGSIARSIMKNCDRVNDVKRFNREADNFWKTAIE